MNLSELIRRYRVAFRVFEGNAWGLDPDDIMFAWVAQESGGDRWAMRAEPGFYRRYIVPKLADPNVRRERWARATSYGLLQIMGQTAREIGFDGRYLTQLCDPTVNLPLACRYLIEDRVPRTDGTWAGALAAYNGGLRGNRRAPYRNAAYVDEIVRRARAGGGGVG